MYRELYLSSLRVEDASAYRLAVGEGGTGGVGVQDVEEEQDYAG